MGMVRKLGILACLLSATAWVAACGDDDGDGQEAGSGGAGGDGGSDAGAGDGGSGGTGGSGGSGGGGRGGSGGSGGSGGPMGNMIMCGTETCMGSVIPMFNVPVDACCPEGVENTCGTDTTMAALVGLNFSPACQPRSQEGMTTTECPNRQISLSAIGIPFMPTLRGCCRPSGVCGYRVDAILSFNFSLGCVDSPFEDDEPVSCNYGGDEPDAGAPDAGSEPSDAGSEPAPDAGSEPAPDAGSELDAGTAS
jgi:hypothetical protein